MAKRKRKSKIKFVISLDSKTERLWKDLKEKLKFKSDPNFLLFLLNYAKDNFAVCRKQKFKITNKKNSTAKKNEPESKNDLLPLRFQHVGNRRYKVVDILNQDEYNLKKCDLCFSAKNYVDEKNMNHEPSCQQFIQAGLLTKVTSNNFKKSDDDKDNILADESFNDFEILSTDPMSKDLMNLKVSEMARSRFEDDLEAELTETSLFDEKLKCEVNNGDNECSHINKPFYGVKSKAENNFQLDDKNIILNEDNDYEKENYSETVLNDSTVGSKRRIGKNEHGSTNKIVLHSVPIAQQSENYNCLPEDCSKAEVVAENFWDASVPSGFVLRVIDHRHGPSIFTNAFIAAGTEIGPLMGEFLREMDILDDCDMRGIWPIVNEEKIQFLCTQNAESSNWLRYMRPGADEKSANCVTVASKGSLFFRVIREVSAGEELLYWTNNMLPQWGKKQMDKTKCGGCHLEFGHTIYYRLHCMIFHDPSCNLNIRKFYCKICGVSILGKEQIIKHAVEAHEGKGAYQCRYCQRFFLRLRHVDLHRTYSCPKNPNRSKIKCDICNQEFSGPQKLQNHKKRQHSKLETVLKEFQCEDCKKILGTSSGLLRHKKEVHNKDLPVASCDRCGKVFQNRSNLKVHMLTHSGVKPFRCQEQDCSAGFASKQRLQQHYKLTHGLDGNSFPEIRRSVEFTFDAYSGNKEKGDDPEVPPSSPPLLIDENQSEGMSPLSVGCSADLPPLSVSRPDGYADDDAPDETDVDEARAEDTLGYTGTEGINSYPCLPSKGSRKWMGSPPLYRYDNYSAHFLVEEAICAAEKDIEKDVIDDVLPYDPLPSYMGSPSLEEPKECLPRDYSASSPPLEEQRNHLYPTAMSPMTEDKDVLTRSHSYHSTPQVDENREIMRPLVKLMHPPPSIGFKLNIPREYVPQDEPRDALKSNSLLRDYNISSLIREDLQEDQDCRERGLIDPGKDPEVSEYRSGLYRDESRDGLADLRRPTAEFYRRDSYDTAPYSLDNEAQNLSLKEKSLHLDLTYKSYEGLEELDRIGRDPAGLENLLVGDQGSQAISRSLHLSPRYPPTYDAESMDLTLPRIPYPSSPIYSLDLQSRFDIPSGRLVDLRSHLGLSPHRFATSRVVPAGATSPSSASFLYQPTFSAPSARLSPAPSYHPYSAYY